MIAAVVEMLMVFAPSPPVPTVSTARSEILIGEDFFSICSTNAITSAGVSPFSFKPRRKCLIWETSALPSNI